MVVGPERYQKQPHETQRSGPKGELGPTPLAYALRMQHDQRECEQGERHWLLPSYSAARRCESKSSLAEYIISTKRVRRKGKWQEAFLQNETTFHSVRCLVVMAGPPRPASRSCSPYRVRGLRNPWRRQDNTIQIREIPSKGWGVRFHASRGLHWPRSPHAAGQPSRLFGLFRGPYWTLLANEAFDANAPSRPGLCIQHTGPKGEFVDPYALAPGECALIRPDGYVGAIVGVDEATMLAFHLARMGLASAGEGLR
ncbi:hypothetical protein GGQ67_003586 [Rhizobium metallidurans]|uniref:Uncharacterized protein n=1 Tax=Rhizobium metallidurans TaxID=1265931 RepID=A0A7W6GCA2_9HYPH|nr:hypothetical protein [Rhizobium metallidurans]